MVISYEEYIEYDNKKLNTPKLSSRGAPSGGGEKNFSIITKFCMKRFHNIKFGYFILCLIYSLFKTFDKMKLGGGFVRDLFLDYDIHDYNIDLDIYIKKDDLLKIQRSIDPYNISQFDYKTYIRSIIDPIVNYLFLIIFDVSINIESIMFYKIKTYVDKSVYCISYKYSYQDFNISIDVNYIGYHSFCNKDVYRWGYIDQNTKLDFITHNMDYEQNGIQLTYNKNNLENDIECNMFRKYDETNIYIKKKLSKINTYVLIHKLLNIHIIDNFLPNNIIKNIYEYIGLEYIYLLKIIYTITKKIMYPSHTLCTNKTICCDNNNNYACKCSRCFEIYNKMKSRHLKFSKNFTVYKYRCNNKYCICDGILNDFFVIDNDYLLTLYNNKKYNMSYNEFAYQFCITNNIKPDIINYTKQNYSNIKFTNKILNNINKFYYGSYLYIYKNDKKMIKK